MRSQCNALPPISKVDFWLEVWKLEDVVGVVVERLLMVELVRSAFYGPTRDYPSCFETHFSKLARDRYFPEITAVSIEIPNKTGSTPCILPQPLGKSTGLVVIVVGVFSKEYKCSR